MKKLRGIILLLGFLSVATILFGWTGSDITCTLTTPTGSGGTTTLPLPAVVYGVVKNGSQAVDYHFVQVYNSIDDVTPDIQTWCNAHAADLVFTNTVQDNNSASVVNLLESGVFLRLGNSFVSGKRYVIVLRAKDITDMWAVDWSYVYFKSRQQSINIGG